MLTLALILGTVIGGGISSSGAWRWVFLFKYVPLYLCQLPLVLTCLPHLVFLPG